MTAGPFSRRGSIDLALVSLITVLPGQLLPPSLYHTSLHGGGRTSYIFPPPTTTTSALNNSRLAVVAPISIPTRTPRLVHTSPIPQFAHTSSHSGSHASQNTSPFRRDACRTWHEHEYCCVHRARARYHDGFLHRRCVWNTHMPRFRPYARISAMRVSRRVLLWYLSARTYVQARSMMAVSVVLALGPERAREEETEASQSDALARLRDSQR